MLLIKKGPEPVELRARREAEAERYDDLHAPELDAIRAALLSEQRGLCCYCMGRINWENNAGMRIEHFLDRASHPDAHLDWQNLLGACPGNEGASLKRSHCDVHKRAQQLSLNPLHEPLMKRVTYSASGQVGHQDEARRREMGTPAEAGVLNLNLALLVRNRNEALAAFRQSLGKRRAGSWSPRQLLKEIDDAVGDRRLPEYWGYIRWWLEKQLRHRPAG